LGHEVVLQCEDSTEMLEDVYKEPTETSVSAPQEEWELRLDLRIRILLNPSIVRCPEQGVATLKVQNHLVQEPFCACSQVMKAPAVAPIPRPMKTPIQVSIWPGIVSTNRERKQTSTWMHAKDPFEIPLRTTRNQ
jgi:hypothetical protein